MLILILPEVRCGNSLGETVISPIFMSARTSVLSMLPLAVLPGKGAELYQGLGIR